MMFCLVNRFMQTLMKLCQMPPYANYTYHILARYYYNFFEVLTGIIMLSLLICIYILI